MKTSTRVFSDEDGTRTETLEGDGDRSQAYVVIRADGSFDFSHTMLAMVEGFEQLRDAGDRVYPIVA